MKPKAIIVSGYFNPIHKGHIEYFQNARANGDELFVIVNSDFQRALKGSKEFQDEKERLFIIESLRLVDKCFLSIDQDRTVVETIKMIFNQFGKEYLLAFANGGDQNNDTIPERPICEELGIGFVPWWPLACQLLTGAIDVNTRFAPGDIRANTSRYSPENLPENLKLVDLIKIWAIQKQASPAQISLAWLLAQKPWIVPIPGTTEMSHMLQNIGADNVKFTKAELMEFNKQLDTIPIVGERLPALSSAFTV